MHDLAELKARNALRAAEMSSARGGVDADEARQQLLNLAIQKQEEAAAMYRVLSDHMGEFGRGVFTRRASDIEAAVRVDRAIASLHFKGAE